MANVRASIDLALQPAAAFAGEVLAPLLSATAPAAFGDWLTDRRARLVALFSGKGGGSRFLLAQKG